jgi:hypothetical protein
MSRAIVTLVIGETFKKIARITHPFMQHYARKINAEFVPIHKSIYAHYHFDKLQIYTLLNKYSRIIYLDTDILIKLNCPNLFEIVPENAIGMYDESAPATQEERKVHQKVLQKASKKYNLPLPKRTEFYNAGVIVISAQHNKYFQPPEKVVFMEYGDQPLINLRLMNTETNIFDIGYKFNRMPYLNDYKHVLPTGEKITCHRTDCHIIHYAGIPNVIEEAKKDIEHLYPLKTRSELITPINRHQMFNDIQIEHKDCVEVGVLRGKFSKVILDQNPKNLWMIDPWIYQNPSIYPDDSSNMPTIELEEMYYELIYKYRADNRVHIIRDKSFNAVDRFSNKSLDFIYLDAIHTMESTLLDMVAWFPKLKKDGWLCGHDFTGKFPGVRLAIETFCKLTKQQISLITMEAAWASWGIQKR